MFYLTTYPPKPICVAHECVKLCAKRSLGTEYGGGIVLAQKIECQPWGRLYSHGPFLSVLERS